MNICTIIAAQNIPFDGIIVIGVKGLKHLSYRARFCALRANGGGRLATITGLTMVLILDGNSDICAQVRGNICYSICLRHLL